jgi:hypothetical protein
LAIADWRLPIGDCRLAIADWRLAILATNRQSPIANLQSSWLYHSTKPGKKQKDMSTLRRFELTGVHFTAREYPGK